MISIHTQLKVGGSHQETTILIICESILLQPLFPILVWQQPLLDVVIVMAAKEEVA